MAAPWIKWSKGLTLKREVLLLSAELGRDVHEIAGRLMRFWEWLDDNVTSDQVDEDGNARVTLGALPLALVDSISGVTGFGEALTRVRWLMVDGGDLVVINFGRHNGETAKTRSLTAVRVAKHKSKKTGGNAAGNATGNAVVTDSALPRGEEIREEERGREMPPPANDPTALDHERAIIEPAEQAPAKNPAHKGWEPTPKLKPETVAAVRRWQEWIYANEGAVLPFQTIEHELKARTAEGWTAEKFSASIDMMIRKRAKNPLDPDKDYQKSERPRSSSPPIRSSNPQLKVS